MRTPRSILAVSGIGMSRSRDEPDKWSRVKVKDEFYVLKESISDTSSSDDSDSSDDGNTARSSNGSGSDSSDSDSSGNRNPQKGTNTASSVVEAPEVATAIGGEPNSAVMKPTAQKALSPEYVPLRSKGGNADTNEATLARKRSDSLSKETPERWRMRLWPSKAIIAFCRIITRCKPPPSTPGLRIGASGGSKHRNEKVELVAHWRKSELLKVPTVFKDPTEHSSVFFLLSVEECREAVTKAEDPDVFVFEGASRLPKSGQHDPHGRNGWLDGEITSIVAESPSGALPKACDPRLGSVWVVAAAISPRTPVNTSAKHYHGDYRQGKPGQGGREGLEVSGGDLMVLHSPSWSHPLLGVIQPWDPDYDIKYGINFSINQSTYISTQQVSCGTAHVVNILVTVDQSDGMGDADVGGWASQGSIRTGVRFSMAPIGNVMTYIRECQALMSLKLISRSLQSMVLTGAFTPGSIAVASADSARGGSVGIAATSPRKAVLSPRKLVLEQPVHCPENIPMPLWLALSRQYNASQLRAICMVSRRFQEKHFGAGGGSSSSSSGAAANLVESSLTLLQGPPGTGKTRTILGIVSVFLAGALNLTAQGSTRIVVGASLYGDLAGENSTKWSDEKLSRPRGGSVSLTSNSSTNVDGSASAGKRTRVLICAPSNTAVDEVVYRLITQGVLDSQGKRKQDLTVVRVGQPSRDEYQKQGIEVFGKQNQGRGGSSLSASEENMIRVVERATLDTLVEERRRALAASDTRQHGVTLKAADIRKQILDQADVVCSTLSGAGSQPMLEVVLRMTGFKFDAVIIDEAAQAVEPSSLIPFKYNPQAVVLVGDPCQLPATVFSRTAKNANYNQSLFERLQAAGYPVLMLETQYRMHPAIADYPSQRFYQGRLVTGSQLITSDTHSKPYHSDPSGRFRPFVFHNVSYSQESTEGTSLCNREEAQYVVDLFEDLVRKYPDHRGGIGIIAPYRAQRRLLNNLFRERFGANRRPGGPGSNLPQIWDLDTEISTVDGFQGREKSIVIFSCVRAPTSRTARYYKSQRPSEDNRSLLSEQALTSGGSGQQTPVIVQSRSTSELSSAGRSDAGSSEADAPFRSIGFLKEWQRLNVAITRSRYALWVVGHADVLREDSEWKHLIEYAEKKGAVYNAPIPRRFAEAPRERDGAERRQGDNPFVPPSGRQQGGAPPRHNSSHHKHKNNWKDKQRAGQGRDEVRPQQNGGPNAGANESSAHAPLAPKATSGKRANIDFPQRTNGEAAKKPKPPPPATVPRSADSAMSALAAAVASSNPAAPVAVQPAPVPRPVTAAAPGSSAPWPFRDPPRPAQVIAGPFSSAAHFAAPAPPLPVPRPGTSGGNGGNGASSRGPFSGPPPVVIKQEPQWTPIRPPFPSGQPPRSNP